ncbi:GH92 family glycosyl hydrolase [uncultured Dysgonomonas sp.]|uniref:Alpha-1,2-mannosidase n=1 Tax=uncultured Dysgonomonas sp. TaxID=206096 RepID=A0A212JVQ8_9BACT|nr:GH92 family glycosyl hydrolase [uncultured Dysgonomonas sp.]SBW03467.1 conserved hypothetical protein [uncultured Dysgonomonas sp.]
MKNNLQKIVLTELLFLATIQISCSQNNFHQEIEPVNYVNPYIGNISHLLVPTYPTIHLPNAMLRIYPERADLTADQLHGLPMTVTSHRGASAFNLSPIQVNNSNLSPVLDYSYDLEEITPYCYNVFLDEMNIAVKFAPSYQAAVYSFVYEDKGDDNSLIINSRNGYVAAEANTIEGCQHLDDKTTIYFFAELDNIPHRINKVDGKKGNRADGENAALILNFGARDTISIRYGISFISVEQSKQNLAREIHTYDVNNVALAGRKIWNETLDKIQIKGGTEDQKIVFYTSLYRTYERMINISEDGQYFSAFDGQVHNDQGIPFYTDDWIWDTYRATHPLRILIEPEKEQNMIRSFIRMAEQSPKQWMPTFPEVTGDSHRMNGNHAVATIWDAYCKGLTDFDLEQAYISCKGAITEKSLLPWTKTSLTELDLFYQQKGYFPALNENEPETCTQVHGYEKRQSISVILGNSYDNWCLAQIAKTLGYEDEYAQFMKMAYSYRNVYNKETGFFHPRHIDGNFIEPFDYRFSGGQGARAYYGENNGWIYRWDVQHNPADLIDLMGGRMNFIKNLNQTFREPIGKAKFEFYSTLPDHTGNVGQFSMANEPCLHIPYLYNYAGQPWMTQKRIRTLLNQWFRNDLMGMPGDEDGGGMTAFVVFSAMGFYPVTPGLPIYNIGSPLFENIKIDLGNDNFFEIMAINASDKNKYIQSAALNGKPWNKPWFSHHDIKNGGKLELIMSDKASMEWGTGEKDVPPSAEPLIK